MSTEGSMSSLMEGLAPAPAAPRRASLRERVASLELSIKTRVREGWNNRKSRRWMQGGMAAAGLALAAGLFLALRPVPQPDYLNDDLDDVLGFTLLTDEFNALPVEERLKLVGQLVQRFRSMSSEDSLLMAGFAAGVAGAAREQIERNASRLAVDVWDKYAIDYSTVPESEREAYLENAYVEFTKLMESVGGSPRDISDEERLDEARRNAQRDRERLRDPDRRQPDGESLGRVFSFMNTNVGSHASPQQRLRGQQMMRDMVRHFRGQDPETGRTGPR